ncbi:hypothetical protein [Amnibacterium kyonggiense]
MATYHGLRCATCSALYTGFTTASLYCGPVCRQRAFRARRTAEARVLAFDEAARGLTPSALRHLIAEAQRLLASGV